MKLFGLSGSRDVFRKITSHPQQAIGCELFRAMDGDMLDQRVLRIRNGELEIEILVDRGFDIGRVLYRGIPTQWVSPAGFRHAHSFTPSAIEPDGWGWLRSWQGGFLSTIGIDHVGGPVTHPNRHLHPAVTGERRFVGGFVSLSPTTIEKIDVDWEKGTIEVQAKVRQAAAFAEHLVMTRKISMNFGEATFKFSDVIQNDGYIEEPVQLLYHINLGWPFLAPGTKVSTSCSGEMLAKPFMYRVLSLRQQDFLVVLAIIHMQAPHHLFNQGNHAALISHSVLKVRFDCKKSFLSADKQRQVKVNSQKPLLLLVT